ncbi:TPA: hypothetical protein N0F65_009961 [Lagenidium giganteum]|uniref:RCC1-like domain-containing protein n=1 Tax=Lagenidium giganteum TaxID=4803 RepID=A0AAV2YW56_9STRA|nr:TPA: hypothetical protein N0F65_009961 [Lagenidium giganteum]
MVLLMRVRTRAAAAARAASKRASYSTQSSVWLWGTGNDGQLGHGPVIKAGIRNAYEELTPKLVQAFEGASIVKMDLGVTHSAAIDASGRLYTWGSNKYNKLGLTGCNSEMETEPRLVEALDGIEIVDVSCGHYHTAAVDKDGKMYSWGWGSSTLKGCGALGHAGGQDEATPRLVSTLVEQGVPVAQVACGEFHTTVLSQDGELWICGNGEYGRLGSGDSVNYEVPEPVEFFAKDNITSIAAGKDFSFAITDDGELYGWGGNSSSQLGQGGGMAVDLHRMESIPALIEALGSERVTQVAAGVDHAAAVTEDGRMFMWGAKLWQEPHQMAGLNDHRVVQVACGSGYTAALTDDGMLFTFGKGSSNALGHGDRKNQLQPVPVAALSNYKLTSIVCGDHHMGAISEPHSEAADKDFSFRE